MRINRISFLLAACLSPLAYSQAALVSKPLATISPAVLGSSTPISTADIMKLDLYTPDLAPAIKGAIASKPLQYLDPKTKKPISASTIIENFAGKKVTASQYYAELNEQEKFLSSLGYDIQAGEDEDYGAIQKPLSLSSFKTQQLTSVLATISATQLSAQDVVKFSSPETSTSLMTGISASDLASPSISAPTAACTSANTSTKPLDWSTRLGNSNFNVDVKAAARFEASCNRVAGLAETNLDGAVFKKSFNVMKAKISTEAVRSKSYKVDLDVFVVGKKVYDFDRTQATAYSNSGSYSSTPVDFSSSIRVPVGPINLSVRVGAKGAAKFSYSIKFTGISALATVTPELNNTVYVEAGIDAVVAEAGAGASLLLVKVKLPVSALAEVLPKSGVLNLHGKLYGYVDLRALDGDAYVYVKVYVPRWGIPPWKKKTYKKVIADWDGYSIQRTIFNHEVFVPLNSNASAI